MILFTPALNDLWFRKEMLVDSGTMPYNREYGGTILFPPDKWTLWHDRTTILPSTICRFVYAVRI